MERGRWDAIAGFASFFAFRHSPFAIPAVLAAAFSLTIPQSVVAIGGIDQTPPPSAKHEVKFATPKETRLENGLRVIVAERPSLPLLAAQVVIRNGAEVDPLHLAGTASFAASLLTKGTESMSAPQIASTIESLGGSIDSGAGWDMSGASVAPTIAPVAKITAELAPVSACAAARRTTLPRTRASSAISLAEVTSIIGMSAQKAW